MSKTPDEYRKKLIRVTPAKPGEIKNPWGCYGKKGEKPQNLVTIWKKLLALNIDEFTAITGIKLAGPVADEMRKSGAVMASAIAGSAIVRAIQGDNVALNFLLERIDGKLPNEFIGDSTRPVVIVDYRNELKQKISDSEIVEENESNEQDNPK